MEHGDETSQPRYQWQQLSLTNNRCCMYSFWAPDDGRGNRLKHVELWRQ
jgi:hypothetical protein